MPTQSVPAGMAVVEKAMAGRFAEIQDMFAPPLRPLASAETLQAAWTAEVDKHGPVSTVGTPVGEPDGTVKIPVTFEHGELTVIVSVDDEGHLLGIQLAPASAAAPMRPWEPPSYARPETFDEQDVTLGTGPLAVPGTLSVPREPRPCPAILLLAGSGPHDRDETIGRNKPLKDLAWGLASSGIAVLRFEKVTYAHGPQVAPMREFTVTDEYVPDALAGIALLRAHPAVDPSRIFVLGHSLGGTVAPRVAAAEPSVAGLIMLAGGAQPLHWAAVRQVSYLATPTGDTAAVETLTRQAKLVDSPTLSPSTPDSELPFGVPAAYWMDLRDYRPAELAATLDRPILLLQGGRDYQVTVADDLAIWRAGLADRPDTTIRVHDDDNHLLFAGSGPSTPAEYEPAQHVDPAIVTDIVDWLPE
ncbi:MAG TPA: alpha/beta fold hydrolase [Pseudonocardiaceae bacterium]